MGGAPKKPHNMKADAFDFPLAPHVLGWRNEANIRMFGLKASEFEFYRIIGISTFGWVRLAQHKASSNYVACKCMKKTEIVRLKQVGSMQMEAEMMKALNHPFIARCGGTFQDATRIYLIVELCPGGDLYSHIKRQSNKRLPESATRFYAASVVMALMYLHNRDLIFRALNSDNVLIDAEGYIKLVDFQQVAGVVERPNKGRDEYTKKRLASSEYWTVSDHPGPELVHKLERENTYSEIYAHERRRFTPHYFAPEVVSAKRHGKETDWWSLGVLIFEMIVGYTPFYDADPPGLYEKITRREVEYPPVVSPLCRDLLSKLLVVDRLKRLGYKGSQDVVQHKWFLNFTWQKLLYRNIKAPFRPQLMGPSDTKYFYNFAEPATEKLDDAKAGALFKFYAKSGCEAMSSVWQAYDEIGAPSLTMLPPRHCMYGAAADAAPPAEEDLEEGEGKDKEGETDDAVIKDLQKASKKKQDLEKKKAIEDKRQEAAESLAEAYGVSNIVSLGLLKKYNDDEEKVAKALEKMSDRKFQHEDSDI